MITKQDSNIKRLEIESVAYGLRDVARQLYLSNEIPSVSDYCRKKGLYAICSEFLVKLEDSDKPYSNKGVLVKGKDNDAYN
ncbi:MAG: hypothetical protein HGA85_08780, partial [Nanoarchaeota archaeon]|nr:hypothetical protein [Nanoarchaeota archaeon]